jgi:hypothetical protein
MAGFVFLMAGCGGEENRSSGPSPGSTGTTTAEPSATTKKGAVVVQLREQNGSGESGTATLVGWPKKADILVELDSAPSTAQPAHIHTGSCDDLGDPRYKLADVVAGKSVSVFKVETLPGEEGVTYAINVHKSYDEIDTYVACGDIP